MKKAILFLCISALLLTVAGCGGVTNVPKGYISSEEHPEKGSFQDSTDYCLYRYADTAPVANDSRYHAITADEVETVKGYFDNFADWMQAEDRMDEYGFDAACISEGDYVYLITKENQPIAGGVYGAYDNYSVWFFDVGSLTLYYIHNNI